MRPAEIKEAMSIGEDQKDACKKSGNGTVLGA